MTKSKEFIDLENQYNLSVKENHALNEKIRLMEETAKVKQAELENLTLNNLALKEQNQKLWLNTPTSEESYLESLYNLVGNKVVDKEPTQEETIKLEDLF